MDRYNERLVKGHPGPEAKAAVAAGVLVFLAAIGLVVTGILVKAVIAIAALPVLVIGVYVMIYAMSLFHVEFEYNITNGDIEVAKITAKKRRKTIREIRGEDITRVARASDDRVKNDLSRADKKKVADYTAQEEGEYYVVFEKVKGTDYMYVLDLNEECLQHLREVLKGKVER